MDYRRSSSLSRSLMDDDFNESDVWDVLNKDQEEFSIPGSVCYGSTDPVNSITRRVVPSTVTMIPSLSSSSSSNYSTPEPMIFQQSAPVNVPNWSGVGSKKNSKKDWEDSGSYGYGGGGSGNDNGNVKVPVDDDDEDDETGSGSVIPPHEFLASRLARSHISSFSVFEGVGRTLKGRDLSKVRNAVLTRTGFLESP